MIIEQVILMRALMIALICDAIYFCCLPNEIFGRPASAIEDWLLRFKAGHWYWVAKPLFRCSVCMCGIWTIVLYPLLFGLDKWLVVSILLSIGINAIVMPIFRHYDD